jgi:hypothetical protein
LQTTVELRLNHALTRDLGYRYCALNSAALKRGSRFRIESKTEHELFLKATSSELSPLMFSQALKVNLERRLSLCSQVV